MSAESYIQAIARFVVGFGTEQDNIWRDYNLDFAGKITYDAEGRPVSFAPVGNSGYSLGSLQWDFGQGPDLAGPFIEAFEAWFKNHPKATPLKSDPEFVTRGVALQGKALTAEPALGLKRQDVLALSEFVRSDGGSEWVNINIDQNLIGSDKQPNIIVLGKTHGLSLVGVARRLETTTTFKLYDGKGNVDVTDLIYAIGMKTYNQSPGNFTKKLIPFLAGRPTPQEISSWYKQFTGGLFSGVKAATELSQFWSKWRAANDGPLRKLMEREMISQCLANPSEASQSRGAYVVAKQIFEDTGRFGMLTDGIKDGTDFIEAKLFDPKTGAIVIHPVTGRIRHGLLVMKKTAYAWDGAGNAYSATTGVWSAFLVAKINIKNL